MNGDENMPGPDLSITPQPKIAPTNCLGAHDKAKSFLTPGPTISPNSAFPPLLPLHTTQALVPDNVADVSHSDVR